MRLSICLNPTQLQQINNYAVIDKINIFSPNVFNMHNYIQHGENLLCQNTSIMKAYNKYIVLVRTLQIHDST